MKRPTLRTQFRRVQAQGGLVGAVGATANLDGGVGRDGPCGVWIGLSRCHDPLTGRHTHVDTLFASGFYLASTRSSRDARLADGGNHRRSGGGHLVWTPEDSECCHGAGSWNEPLAGSGAIAG